MGKTPQAGAGGDAQRIRSRTCRLTLTVADEAGWLEGARGSTTAIRWRAWCAACCSTRWSHDSSFTKCATGQTIPVEAEGCGQATMSFCFGRSNWRRRDAFDGGALTEADRALLLAMRAWARRAGGRKRGSAEGEHDFILRFWDWLEAGWVRRLCDAWDREAKTGGGIAAARALERLREMHVATVEVELKRVHPSWLVRALQEESPAVQRLVAASVPESLARLASGRALARCAGYRSGPAGHPIFREWVTGLWTERLLGGEASRPDDSPAFVAVCRLSATRGLSAVPGGGAGQDGAGRRKSPERRRAGRSSAAGPSGCTAG